MEKLVEIKNLNVSFNQFTALKNVNCSINSNSGVVGLIGPNGAGKTTLIHSILGQVKIKSGNILCQLDTIAYCPDTPEFDSYITATEVLKQSLKLKGLNTSKEEIEKALKQVGLYNSRNRFAGEFSRGMKQRLGMAAAIILKPKLLFLDEPTSALDPFGREDILSLINKLSKEITVVVSSHILNDIQRVANNLLVLNQGELLFEGSITDFIRNTEVNGIIMLKSGNYKEQVSQKLAKAKIPVIDENMLDKLFFPQAYLSEVFSIFSVNAEGIKGINLEGYSLESAFNHIMRRKEE